MKYIDWAEQASKNAISLAEESRILLSAKKEERAYYLSHMATEEASKSILLSAMEMQATPLSELPKVNKLLRDHKKKIEFVTTIVSGSDAALTKQLQNPELIHHINNLKNNSMYVTCIDGEIKTPAVAISNLDIEQFVSSGEAIAKYSGKFLKNA